jgi:hypothetical protein
MRKLNIDEVAKEIGVDESTFKDLLIGLGFNEIANEAQRYAVREAWKNKEVASDHPSIENLKQAVNAYLED